MQIQVYRTAVDWRWESTFVLGIPDWKNLFYEIPNVVQSCESYGHILALITHQSVSWTQALRYHLIGDLVDSIIMQEKTSSSHILLAGSYIFFVRFFLLAFREIS